jgi:hypothetical protein
VVWPSRPSVSLRHRPAWKTRELDRSRVPPSVSRSPPPSYAWKLLVPVRNRIGAVPSGPAAGPDPGSGGMADLLQFVLARSAFRLPRPRLAAVARARLAQNRTPPGLLPASPLLDPPPLGSARRGRRYSCCPMTGQSSDVVPGVWRTLARGGCPHNDRSRTSRLRPRRTCKTGQ